MSSENYALVTIGKIVADDYRAAAIFKKAGIDFCCGGNKSMEETCQEKNIDIQKLKSELQELELSSINPQLDYKNWDPGFLSDYIVNTHHRYVLKTLEELVFYTQKIAAVHGDHHLELKAVASMFSEVNRELLQHMIKEEEVLFPAIKEVIRNNSDLARETVMNEISRLRPEHEFAGGTMDKINEITGGYKLPDDACNTYRVTFKMLEAFEDDLHTHVHLENNILFPKALSLSNK